MIYLIAAMGIVLFLSIGFFMITNETPVTHEIKVVTKPTMVGGQVYPTTSSMAGVTSGR